jgi:anti-sigma-K factor RskA
MTTKPSKDLGLNSGAYVLHALSDAENERFEAHLAESEEARAEVTELADTAVELGLSVTPVDPPASLRVSILDAIATTPQLAPLPAVEVGENGAAGEHEIAAPGAPVVGARPVVGLAEERARRRWYSRPATTLIAAAAAVALVFGGGVAVNAVIQGQQSTASASQVNQIQAAADYRRASVAVSTGGQATLIWSDSLKTSALLADGLQKLSSSKTYELWYIHDNKATPAGTFAMTGSSVQSIVLDGKMTKGATVGVTVEPAGGSTSPTTKPIAAFTTA